MFPCDTWKIFRNTVLQFLKNTSGWLLLSCYYWTSYLLCYFHFKKNHSWEMFLIAVVFCLFLYISLEYIPLNLISLNVTRYTMPICIFVQNYFAFWCRIAFATSSDLFQFSCFMKFGNHFLNLTLIFYIYNVTFYVYLWSHRLLYIFWYLAWLYQIIVFGNFETGFQDFSSLIHIVEGFEYLSVSEQNWLCV